MPRCRVDNSINRQAVEGFDFPLGVYPIEPMTPVQGFTLSFESADQDDAREAPGSPPPRGGKTGKPRRGEFDEPADDVSSEIGQDEGDERETDADPSSTFEESDLPSPFDLESETESEWEQWPDRYVFDIVIRAGRVEALCRSLFALLPGRFYPILDVLGSDAYREIDPYIAYDLVGQEHFSEALRRYRSFFFEDGLIGFGAMSDEPFIYMFVDEHKIVTVRVEASLKAKVEAVLAAFDLSEVDKIAGADAAQHEHRGVLDAPSDRPDLLCAEEIIEELRDSWGLQLNIDAERNVDETGNDLGITFWRALVRLIEPPGSTVRYAEVYLSADCYNAAVDLACEAAEVLHGKTAERHPARSKPLTPPALRISERQSDQSDDQTDDEGPVGLDVIFCDRMTPDQFGKHAPSGKGAKANQKTSRIIHAQWME